MFGWITNCCIVVIRFDAVHVVPGPENGTFYARAMNLGEAVLKVGIWFLAFHYQSFLMTLTSLLFNILQLV